MPELHAVHMRQIVFASLVHKVLLGNICSLLQGVKELTSLIFHKAQPKRMNNSIITGPMLAALTQAYVDALNHGAVPTIATAWQVPHCCVPITFFSIVVLA